LQTKSDSSPHSPRLKALAIALTLIFVAGFSLSALSESLHEAARAGKKVALPEAARHFGVATSWKPDEWKLSLIGQGHRAEILIGSNRAIVDDYLLALTAPVTADDGTVSMAIEDSAKLFSRLLEREVTEAEISSAGLVFSRRAGATENTILKTVRYISYPRFTRIIINVSGDRPVEDIEVRCLEGAKTLTVELPNSRFMQLDEPIEVGGRIIELIESVQTSADAKLIVRIVPDEVKYEIQKHDDPPRVVVDIRPASPTIVTDFLTSPSLPARANGWAEPEPIAPRRLSPFTTVVIDPGHGGKDNGARGRGRLYEKEVALAIGLKLKELIEERAGMKVVLTRTGDYFVPLKERTAIANHAKEGMPADLFISIHTNAHKSPKVGGFEAFYISDAIDPDAEATAALENAVIDFERGPDGVADTGLTPILWDLQFTEFVFQSSELAYAAQEELGKRLNSRNRGVRQAQFIVLAGVAMPSILVEVGFISNRVEEANLKTADFRNRCAQALAAAVSAFKERRDMRLGLLKEEPNR